MIGEYRVFDAHTHIGQARHSGRRFTAEQMLRVMDAEGIDKALLIPYPVVEDYRAAHEEIAAAARGWPKRFVGAACVPPFLPLREFQEEVARCAGLGFRALKLQPQYQGLNPVSRRSDFFFEAAAVNGLAVIAHTGSGVPFALPSLFIAPARRFPELPIILAHCGGSVYYLETIVAAETCANIYLELSSLMPHHILEILGAVDAGRCMIGSDLPESVKTEIGKIVSLEIGEREKADILWNTAHRLLAT